MSQNYLWPAVSVTATNPSVAPNGSSPSATSSTLVAGQLPSGAQEPLQLDSSGNLLVSGSFTPPALQNVNVTEVGGAAVSLGQKTAAASIPTVLASDQTLPLPTGASTSALQTSGNASLTSISANQTNGTQVTQVSNFPATQPVSGTVTVVQPTGSNLHAVIDSSALPTGASTSALQSAISGQLPATLGQKASAASLAVVVASDQSAIPVSATSLPLPTGAATSANQVIELSRLSGSLVPTAYDEIDLTYSGSNISVATYKLLGSTVKTVTLTYTGSNLTSVVAT